MEERDPTTPFIAAVLAERDRRAEGGVVRPFLWMQPDMLPKPPLLDALTRDALTGDGQ